MITKLKIGVKPRMLCSDMFGFESLKGKNQKGPLPSSFVRKHKPVFSGRWVSLFMGLASRPTGVSH